MSICSYCKKQTTFEEACLAGMVGLYPLGKKGKPRGRGEIIKAELCLECETINRLYVDIAKIDYFKK
jgi:hypothetical protein